MSRAAAEQALAAGDLVACRAHLIEAIRAAPGDPALRSFLFQLACVLGDWDRAAKQLDVLAQLQPATLDFVGDYRAALAAEAARAAVFAGRMPPSVFGGPHPWANDLGEALRLDAAGDADGARALRDRALAAAPGEAGALTAVGADGAAFGWIGDADTRLGPILEVVMNGAYRWLPLAEVAKLELTPPSDLRDVVWAVGMVTVLGGGEWPLMVPARYPGSEASGDAALALGRRTEWRDLGGGHAAGLGQRLLAHDGGDVAILDLRSLVFDRPAEADATAADRAG